MWNHQHKLLPVTSGQHSLSIAQLYLYLYTYNSNNGQPSESINVKTENPTEYAAPACTITSSSTPIIQWYWPLGTGTPLSPGLPRPIIIQVVSMLAWPTHHPASQPLLSRTIVAKVAVTRLFPNHPFLTTIWPTFFGHYIFIKTFEDKNSI